MSDEFPVKWFGNWFVDKIGLAHASIHGDAESYDYYFDSLEDHPGETLIEHMAAKSWMDDEEMYNLKSALKYAKHMGF